MFLLPLNIRVKVTNNTFKNHLAFIILKVKKRIKLIYFLICDVKELSSSQNSKQSKFKSKNIIERRLIY
jgi:hypothetical protein